MKCSACRERLPAYQDGVLASGAAADLEAHLSSCIGCRTFAEEMMVVEHRLARLREIEPRVDFTQLVMAQIAMLPAPARRRSRMLWLGVYDVFAWLIIAILAATGFLRWKVIVAESAVLATKFGVSAGVLYRVADHFHLTTLAAVGAVTEGLVLIAVLYTCRRYLATLQTALFGAQTA